MPKPKFDELISKEVTRRQFLGIIGGMVVGVLGISSLIGIFSDNMAKIEEKPGYGLRNYGP